LKTNDCSEAFEMWSLIKTSLQFKHLNFCRHACTHSLFWIHWCFLQRKIWCTPQNCCSLEGLSWSTAENPSFPHRKGWCTNLLCLSWTHRDMDQTVTGLEIRNEHSPVHHCVYKPKGHLQPLPLSLKKYFFS